MIDNRLEIVLAARDITGKAFDRLRGQMANLGSSVLSLNGVMAGLAGAGGLGLVVTKSLEAAAEIERSAKMAGVSAEAYQELAYAGRQYGITQDALTDGLKELSLRTDEYVQTGVGPAKDAFERLGYSQEQLNKLLGDAPALLDDVVRRMEGLDTAAQIRIADEIFGGTGGEQFVAMIQAGGKALGDFRQEARDLGLVMDQDLIRQSKQAKDEIEKLTSLLSAQLTTTVAELAPDIAEVAKSLGAWIKENKTLLSQDVPGYVSGLVSGLGKVKDVYDAIPSSLTGPAAMGLVGTALFGGGTGKLILALGLVNEGLAVTGNGIQDLVDKHYRAGEAVIKLWESIRAEVGPASDATPGKFTGTIDQDTDGYGRHQNLAQAAAQKTAAEAAAGKAAAEAAAKAEKERLALARELSKYTKEDRMIIDPDEVKKIKQMNHERMIGFMNFDKLNLTEKERRMEVTDADVAATRKALDEWTLAQEKKAAASRTFFDGLKMGFAESQKSYMTWADHGVLVSQRAARNMHYAFSDTLFAALKGDIDDISQIWEGFMDSMLQSLTDTVADMAIQWGIGAIGAVTGWWDKGAWEVKKDHVAVIHKGEMVVPADIASVIRGGEGSPAVSDIAQASPSGGHEWGREAIAAIQGTLGAYAPHAAQGMSLAAQGKITMGQLATGLMSPAAITNAVLAGGIPSAVNESLGFRSSRFGTMGQSLGSMLGGFAMGGPIGALMGALAGAPIGMKIGDIMNARIDEETRDYLEDVLGWFAGQRAYNEAFGFDGGESSDAAASAGGSGGIGVGGTTGGFGGEFGFNRGGIVNRLRVPRGEDGWGALQLGEGIVSRQGMQNLEKINLGQIGEGGPIHIHIEVDGREIARAVVDQARHNGELIRSIREVAGVR